MDYKKVYTPVEATTLYNVAKIRYDPTSYSLKGNLITNVSREKLEKEHIAYFDYKAENRLLDSIYAKERSRASRYSLTGISNATDTSSATLTDMATMFIQQDNLHICLESLQDNSILDLEHVKETNIIQTLVTMCIALNSSKSCAKDIMGLCTKTLQDEPYETVHNFEFVKKALEEPRCAIPELSKHSVDVTYVPTVNTDDLDFNYEEDLCTDSLYAQHIAMFEVLWAYTTLSEEYKACFLALCEKFEIPKQSDFYLFEKYVNLTPIGFSIDPCLENAISEKNPAKRYEMYQELLKAGLGDIYAHCKEYFKHEVPTKHFINPIIAIFTAFVMQISLTNFRINYIRILYNYCIAKGYLKKSEFKDHIPDSFEKFDVSGTLGICGKGSDSKSLMDLEEHAPSKGKTLDVDDTDHTSPALFESLDGLTDSFESGKYNFTVYNQIDTSDTLKSKYNAIASKVKLVNNLLIRKIRDIKTYNVGGKDSGKTSGRLDRKAIYRYKYDPNIFYDNTYKTLESDLAFGIVLDESGSMSGRGIEDGRITMIVLHETLKALGINHSIIGHTSDYKHHCEITRYQAFREDKTYTTCKNYALINAAAKSGNCDSGALYYMEKALSRVLNKDKICLIFSDGAPTECTGTELKNQVRAMERKGIKVIGIGINFESIAKYYTDYANGRNLTDMLNIVAKILEEYVLKKKDK